MYSTAWQWNCPATNLGGFVLYKRRKCVECAERLPGRLPGADLAPLHQRHDLIGIAREDQEALGSPLGHHGTRVRIVHEAES